MNILDLKMEENDAGAETIRDYLKALLMSVIEEEESFSGKRPFGNSGWKWELYQALIVHKAIKGKLDADGCIDECDEYKAEKLIRKAISTF